MCPSPQEFTDLVTFTGEIFNRKLHFVQCEILMHWKAEKEYVRAKYERSDQSIYEPKWDLIVIFWILRLWANHNKIFKSYLKALRQQFTIGTKKS